MPPRARVDCGMLPRCGRGLAALLVLLILAVIPRARADSFDWRTIGGASWITPVRFQDANTCWVYSGAAVLESRLKLTRGDFSWNPDLSEHMAVDLMKTYQPGINISYDSGGLPEYALQFAQSPGLVRESEYPDRNSILAAGWENRVAVIDGGSSAFKVGTSSVNQIKSYLRDYGPISLAIYSGDLGVSTSYIPVMSNKVVDHALLAVGWQDDSTIPEGGYWIFKNSWDTTWGESGYCYARYNSVSSPTMLTSRVHFTGPLASTSWNGGSGNWSNNTAGWAASVNGGLWRNGEDAATFASGSGTITVAANTSAHGVTLGPGAAYTFNGGSLIVTGGGITAHESANFTTPITAGYDQTWNVDAGKTLTIAAVNLNINAVTVAGSGNTVISGAITDLHDNPAFVALIAGSDGSLIKTGNGTLTLSVANTFRGEMRLSAGTLRLGHPLALQNSTLNLDPAGQLILDFPAQDVTLGGLAGTGPFAIPAGHVLTVGNSSGGTYSGDLSGAGSSLVKAGFGVLSLAGTNSYSGGTRVQSGGLVFNSTAALPPAGVLRGDSGAYVGFGFDPVAAGSLFRFDKANTRCIIGIDRGVTSSNLDLTGFDALVRLGSATTGTIAGALTPQGDTYRFGGAGGTLTVSSLLTGNRHLDMGSDGRLSGTIVLATANNYTGNTTIGTGMLQLGAAGALPSGTALAITGGTLDVSSFGAAVSTLLLDGGAITGSGIVNSAGTMDVRSGSIAPPLSGAGSLVKNGSGTVVLSNTNSHTGGTILDAGTLTLLGNGTNKLGSGLIRFSGGTLETAGSVALDNLITFASTGNIQTTSGASTFTGKIDGAGGLAKSGSGALSLANTANSFQGSATVLAGTLDIPSQAVLGVGSSVTVADGAQLQFGGDFQLTRSLDVTGVGPSLGGALRHSSGSTSLGGPLTIRPDTTGAARIYNVSGNLALAGTVNNTATTLTLYSNGSSNQTDLNAALGGVNLQLSGIGKFNINTLQTHSGATRFDSSATVIMNVDNALPTSTALTVGGPGPTVTTLDLNSHPLTVGSLANDGYKPWRTFITSSTPATLSVNDPASTTFQGVLSGAVSLSKGGAGTLTLYGSNTATGDVIVRTGTLKLSAPAAGLYEGRLNGSFNTTSVNPITAIALTTRYANTADTGTGYAATGGAWADNTTFIYSGYLNNASTSSATWTFAENFDESILLKIDGVTVLSDTDKASPSTANFTLTPGRHPIELRLGHAAGAVGPANQGWLNNGIGLGYDTQGRNQQVAANYTPLIDPGDGSLLSTSSTFSAAAALPSTTVLRVAAGATLDLNNISRTVGALSDYGGGGGTVALGAATLAIGSDNSSTTFSGKFTGGGAIDKVGSGTLTLSGSGHSLSNVKITSGRLRAAGALPASAAVTANGGIFEAAASQNVASVTINPGALVEIASGKTIKTTSLVLSGTGALDLGDGGLILDYTGSSPLSDIRSAVDSGYAGGAWNGSGIRSTQAAAAPFDRAVGYADAAHAVLDPGSKFMGQDVDSTAILVRYTVRGDANLDGKVNFADLVIVSQHYKQTDQFWWAGDFNYDHKVDFADLVIVSQHYKQQLGAQSFGQFSGSFASDWAIAMSSAVPEPGGACLLTLAGVLAMARRPKRFLALNRR